MNWFKNLNARPKLMLSFGLPLLLTLVMGSLAISRLHSANDRLIVLYKLDLPGVVVIEDLVINQNAVARFAREAALDIDNLTAVAENEKRVLLAFATMHTDLDAAKSLFYARRTVTNGSLRPLRPTPTTSQSSDWVRSYPGGNPGDALA
jgi:hypothetical protein